MFCIIPNISDICKQQSQAQMICIKMRIHRRAAQRILNFVQEAGNIVKSEDRVTASDGFLNVLQFQQLC